MALNIINGNPGSLDLSAQEIEKLTGWPAPMVEDYLNNSRVINQIVQTVDIDFGSMALQDANNVAITGGNINGLATLGTVNLTVTGTATIGNIVITALSIGNLTVNGNTILGNQSSDSLTIAPGLVSWTNNPQHTGSHTFLSAISILGGASVNGSVTLLSVTDDYMIVWADPAAARELSIIDPGGNDSFVFAAATQTLENKTISGDDNTLSDIATTSLKDVTGVDADVVTGTAGTSGNLAAWNADGDLVDASADVGDFAPIGTTPVISSQAGAPGTTPAKIGDINIDTTAPAVYIATGTASSADWTIVS